MKLLFYFFILWMVQKIDNFFDWLGLVREGNKIDFSQI